MSRLSALVGLLAMLASCVGEVITVSGQQVYERYWTNAVSLIGPRATYELSCPEESLTFSLLSKTGRRVMQVGVVGCGQRVVYVLAQTGWVLNSTSGDVVVDTSPSRARSRHPVFAFARNGDLIRAVRVTFSSSDSELTFESERAADTVRLSVATRTAVPLPPCTGFALRNGVQTVESALSDAAGTLDLEELFDVVEANSPNARFCSRAWALTAEDVAAFRRFREVTRVAQASERENQAQDTEGTPSLLAVEVDELRALIASKSELIRACSNLTGAIAIEAEWDASGRVVLTLRGIDDAVVNDCVEAGFGEVRVSAQESGQLVHVIE